MTKVLLPAQTSDVGVEVLIATHARKVEVRAFTAILHEVLLSLEDVDRTAHRHRTPRLQWSVTDLRRDGGLFARLEPTTIPLRRDIEIVNTPSEGLAAGIGRLSSDAEIPAYFSENTILRVQKIGSYLGRSGVDEVQIASVNGHRVAGVVDLQTLEHARTAVRPTEVAQSSVVGRIDLLQARNRSKPKAEIYDERTRRAVVIRAREDQTDSLRECFGKRVMVSGALTRNSLGQAIRVEMEELSLLPEGAFISARDLLGIEPPLDEGVTAVEYVRSLRRD